MKQWANLDFVRSIAVLAVMASHTALYGPFQHNVLSTLGWVGITGVGFFFVHTSLVLMWSLERDPHVGRFYIRRIFRIYPLWLMIFGLYIAFHIPASPIFAPHFGFHMPQGQQWLWEILLLDNIRFAYPVVGASWTLPLEVQMYLLLPYLFFFVRSTRKLWPLFVLVLFVMLWDMAKYPPQSSELPVCIPYFMGGVIAYQLTKMVRPSVPSWVFPLFIAVELAITRTSTSFRAPWLTCLALGLTLPFFKQMTWRPLTLASHVIAKYSYGIYLTHFIGIVVGFYLLRGHHVVLQLAAEVGTTAILSVSLFHLVEAPMIRLGAKIAERVERGRHLKVDERALNLEPAP